MILYFDTETTGLYPGEICQLAYLMQDAEKTVAKNMFFSVDYVEVGAFAVHGFSPSVLAELSDGKIFCDRIDEIEKDFLSADVVVAHNSAFDFSFMRKEFERCGREFCVNAEFCSMKRTVTLCKLSKTRGAGYKYPKLSELCANFGVTDADICEETKKFFGSELSFHDARYDVVATYLSINKGMQTEDALKELSSALRVNV